MRMRPPSPKPLRKSEQGYILLTLMLIVALLSIAAVAIAPSFAFQMQRDREEEMIHRGVQYSRAVRKYFKKFGRYPTSLDDLQNTNNLRFLRKRYKDPVTGKDFKLLHFAEVQLMGTVPGIAGATPVSAMTQAGAPGAGSNSGFNLGAGGGQASEGQTQPGGGLATSSPASAGAEGNSSFSQVGGGPIVGVISTSKAKSIRSFGGKDHYNEWLFAYVGTDTTAGLISTPIEPPLQNGVTNLNPQAPAPAPGIPGVGAPGTGFAGTQQPTATPSPSQSSPTTPEPQPPDQ